MSFNKPGKKAFENIVRKEGNADFNSLQKNKILDYAKFKAFADVNMTVTKNLKIILGSVENFDGNGENAGHQHFLLFPPCFQKASFQESLKVITVR